MSKSEAMPAACSPPRHRRAWRLLAVCALAWLAAVGVAAERATAMCCSCTGGSCGTGFCVDNIQSFVACATFCTTAGCASGGHDPADTCAGGCGVQPALPTATPTVTVSSPTNTPSATPSRTPSITPTNTVNMTPSATPTHATCCQHVQACSISTIPGVCPAGEDALVGGLCVTGPAAGPTRAPGSKEPTLSLCALPTPTPLATSTPTLTRTPADTPTSTRTPTISATATASLTTTATVTATPRATDTFPPVPTPFVCCEDGVACSNFVGQNFASGLKCMHPSLRTPVPYASCDGLHCVPFLPTGTFTATATQTGTATLTPTITPTLAVPTNMDPYKCYRIKDETDPKFGKRAVELVDKFGKTSTTVIKPFLACNPSNEVPAKQMPGADGTQLNPQNHMVCFKIKDQADVSVQPNPREMRVVFKDETPTPGRGTFTALKPEFVKEDIVCMPAALIPPTPTPFIPCRIDPLPITPCPTRNSTPYMCIENRCLLPTPTK